jgi:hypothetical protein
MGDGTKGQLGYQCEFDEQKLIQKRRQQLAVIAIRNGTKPSDGAGSSSSVRLPKESTMMMQAYPREINPTGVYKRGLLVIKRPAWYNRLT